MNILAYVHLRNIYGSTGAGRVARQLIEHVAPLDDVTLHILADQTDHRNILPKVGSPWTEYNYHLFERDTSDQQARWLLTRRPYAETFWPEAQLVHCTMEAYVPTSRAKLMITAHDAAYFEKGAHPRNFSAIRQRLKWHLLYATLDRKCDAFHTVSHFSAERLGAVFPAIKSRLRVVHNAVTQRFFEPVNAAGTKFLEKNGLNGRRYVLLPGGLHYRKNAELVLKAWPILHQLFPDLLLVISSHCDPQFVPAAQALGDSVRMTGFIDDDILCALYTSAQVMWFPSKYEGFGLPLLESMACGTPAVASNSTSIPEVAGDAAVLVDPGSVAEHVEGIRLLLDDARLREELTVKGRARAAQFTWAASAAKLRDVYRSLL